MDKKNVQNRKIFFQFGEKNPLESEKGNNIYYLFIMWFGKK